MNLNDVRQSVSQLHFQKHLDQHYDWSLGSL